MTSSRLRLVGFLALLGCLPAPAPAQAVVVERIVAVVGARIVLLTELQMRVREYLPQLAQQQALFRALVQGAAGR